MSTLKVLLMFFCLSLSVQTYAAKEKEEIPKEDKWEKTIEQVLKNVYCRISFELKHKQTSETIAFSKYFRVNAIKGSHSHVDTCIN